jgi:hypothetical protein
MSLIFQLVAGVLALIADLTGYTYNEVNIIVYYIIIPLSWTVLFDKIFKFHYTKIAYSLVILGTLLIINNFTDFSDWLFEKSADFLFGLGDYVLASVFVCVFLIIIVYGVLIYFAYYYKKTSLNHKLKPQN